MTSVSNPALLLENETLATVVTVHPLVLLSVLDHHTRRQEANGRVIGTLLGRRDGNKVCTMYCTVLYCTVLYYDIMIGLIQKRASSRKRRRGVWVGTKAKAW